MKRLIVSVCIVVLPVTAAFAQGAQQMIKQRAKDLSNQNNARQGLPPSYPPPAQNPMQPKPPAPPAPPAAPPVPPVPSAVAKLQADLAAMKAKPEVASGTKQQFIKDLMADVQGAGKPTELSAGAFADHLAAAIAGKNLSPAQQLALAQNIHAIINNSGQQTPKEAVFDNVQVVLQAAGATRSEATAVTGDLKIIDFQIQKPAPK